MYPFPCFLGSWKVKLAQSLWLGQWLQVTHGIILICGTTHKEIELNVSFFFNLSHLYICFLKNILSHRELKVDILFCFCPIWFLLSTFSSYDHFCQPSLSHWKFVVQLSFFLLDVYPTSNYMFKVKYRNTRLR